MTLVVNETGIEELDANVDVTLIIDETRAEEKHADRVVLVNVVVTDKHLLAGHRKPGRRIGPHPASLRHVQ